MPWSKTNTIPSLSNKSDKVKEVFAEAANAALSRGMSEEEAIFAGLAAVKNYERKHSVQKAIIPKQEPPAHLKAILEAKALKEQEQEKLQKQSEVSKPQPKIRKEFLGKNAIESDSERSLVNAEWDNQGRLILTFDDGEQIITSPVPVSEYIEQHVGVVVKEESALPEQYDHIQFNVESTSEVLPARLVWNPEEGTLDLGMNGGDVVQHIGLETFYRVKNQTGSTITNGTVVMAIGAVGNSGHILVAPANNAMPPQVTMGIATHDIPNGENGFVTHFGLVKQINTTGSDVGETWLDGDILYLHPILLGKLTKVKPAAPNYHVMVALVVHAHQNGQLFVRPTYGQKLDDVDDVQITNPQNGQILKYDGPTQTWKNVDPSAASGITTSSYFIKVNTVANTPLVINHGLNLIDKDAFTFNAMLGGEMVQVGVTSLTTNSMSVVTSVSTTNLCLTIVGVIA